MYDILKNACSINKSLRSWAMDIKESNSAIMDLLNIFNEYDEKGITKIPVESKHGYLFYVVKEIKSRKRTADKNPLWDEVKR